MTLPSLTQRFIVPDLPSTDEIIPYLREIDANRWYTNFGPLSTRFVERFAARMAAAHQTTEGSTFHAVGLASGHQALTVGLRLLGAGEGARVLVPSVTFPACALAISQIGAEAVLSDVNPESWTLTPALARAVASKTKLDVVMPVAVYGFPLPAPEWDAFARETGIKVLIDAAAAIESQRYLETGLVAHSLHALKPMGIGEGGLLVAADPDMAATIRERINFGLAGRISRQTGENAKMSEYHAAVALAQLDRWDAIKARRKKAYDLYVAALAQLATRARAHPHLPRAIVSSLMVELKDAEAAPLHDALVARGVAAHRTYLPPLYDHPAFAGLEVRDAAGALASDPATRPEAMVGAEHLKRRALGLPFHSFLGKEDIQPVITALGEVLGA